MVCREVSVSGGSGGCGFYLKKKGTEGLLKKSDFALSF
jgi:hypothetical protein